MDNIVNYLKTPRDLTDLDPRLERDSFALKMCIRDSTWIDQPYISQYHPGWALTTFFEPTFEVRDRCVLSTSTRKMIQKIDVYKRQHPHRRINSMII